MKWIDDESVKSFIEKINIAEKNTEFPSVSSFIDKNNFNNPFVNVKLEEILKFFFTHGENVMLLNRMKH